MLLDAHTLLAGLGGPSPRNASVGVQIVNAGGMSWSKKRVFLRNQNYRAFFPTEAQRNVRIAFGEIGLGSKGSKGLTEGLPGAAASIRMKMKNTAGSYGPPTRMERKTFHTLEELKAMS